MASVSKLEEENTNLKVALDVANQEVIRLKNDKMVLSDKASELVGKKNDLEAYLGGLAKKLFLMLEGNPLYLTCFLILTSPPNCCLNFGVVSTEFCKNFEEETGRLETSLDPINSPMKDKTAMSVL